MQHGLIIFGFLVPSGQDHRLVGKQTVLPDALKDACIAPFLEALMRRVRRIYSCGIQCVPPVSDSEYEEDGIHYPNSVPSWKNRCGKSSTRLVSPRIPLATSVDATRYHQ